MIAIQKRHHRTFSEDERIQAQENVKKVEDDDAGEISEPEDPLMLQRDAKDWKVYNHPTGMFWLWGCSLLMTFSIGTRPLRCSRPLQISI